MAQQVLQVLDGELMYNMMELGNTNNKKLNTLLNEVKGQHDELKKHILEKLSELDKLENKYKTVLEEIKKRYNI
jgi:flagellar motility protein MotE (MotC chaperone)